MHSRIEAGSLSPHFTPHCTWPLSHCLCQNLMLQYFISCAHLTYLSKSFLSECVISNKSYLKIILVPIVRPYSSTYYQINSNICHRNCNLNKPLPKAACWFATKIRMKDYRGMWCDMIECVRWSVARKLLS